MLAPILALEWIAEKENEPDNYRVKLFSDSQFFVQTVLGHYERRANLRLWTYWDEVARDVDLFISWTPAQHPVRAGAVRRAGRTGPAAPRRSPQNK